MILSLFQKSLLVVLLIILSYLLWKNKSATRTRWVLAGILLITFLLRLINVSNAEGNVDTSTWLTSAISILHYPDPLWTVFNYTDSRPLTVLPLVVASKLGLEINYAGSQVVSILLWLASLSFFYFAVSLFQPKTHALLYTWILCLFIGTTGFFEFICYNSEHISIFMLTLASYWYFQNEKEAPISNLKTLVLGLVLGSLLFAKFQNIPMGFVIGGFCLISFVAQKSWNRVLLLVTGSVLPTVLVNGYYAWHNELPTFWNNYFWNYFYYSYTNEFSSTPLSERFNPLRIGTFIFVNKSQGFYFLSLLAVALAGTFLYLRARPKLTPSLRTNGAFAFLFILASLYATVQSGNFFYHYLLYLLIPSTYLIVWLVSHVKAPARPILLGVLLTGSLVQASYNILTRQPLSDTRTERTDREVIAFIRKNSQPTDRVVIWGWADRLYVRSHRPAGYRYPQSVHLFLKSSLFTFRKKTFLEDIDKNKPLLFVDVLNSEVREYSTKDFLMKPHYYIRDVRNYVRKHYRLISTINGIKIYKRISPLTQAIARK
ncbi:hypothetical protein [Telluribacter sp. SYSU D00476]|uniref:hypothetical protein n=1 Tax=Telluribacter sp. SYSU D00476 TaxID=2811430 RepID=UPI001FF69A85|nr:hypothetical protein [Telluribacter sp. SYSU D00476]